MAGILNSRFNWKPRASAWQQMQQQRERNKAARAENEAAMATMTNMLNTVSADTATQLGELAAKKALARIQAEALAKAKAKDAKTAADNIDIWKNKTPPKQLTAGDTKIDLAGNTITLSDGTLLDIKTGVKKVNLKM